MQLNELPIRATFGILWNHRGLFTNREKAFLLDLGKLSEWGELTKKQTRSVERLAQIVTWAHDEEDAGVSGPARNPYFPRDKMRKIVRASKL